jgi:hypothetical protein
MKTKLKKITYHKLGLKNKIKNNSKFHKRTKNKNYKSKQ